VLLACSALRPLSSSSCQDRRLVARPQSSRWPGLVVVGKSSAPSSNLRPRPAPPSRRSGGDLLRQRSSSRRRRPYLPARAPRAPLHRSARGQGCIERKAHATRSRRLAVQIGEKALRPLPNAPLRSLAIGGLPPRHRQAFGCLTVSCRSPPSPRTDTKYERSFKPASPSVDGSSCLARRLRRPPVGDSCPLDPPRNASTASGYPARRLAWGHELDPFLEKRDPSAWCDVYRTTLVSKRALPSGPVRASSFEPSSAETSPDRRVRLAVRRGPLDASSRPSGEIRSEQVGAQSRLRPAPSGMNEPPGLSRLASATENSAARRPLSCRRRE